MAVFKKIKLWSHSTMFELVPKGDSPSPWKIELVAKGMSFREAYKEVGQESPISDKKV